MPRIAANSILRNASGQVHGAPTPLTAPGEQCDPPLFVEVDAVEEILEDAPRRDILAADDDAFIVSPLIAGTQELRAVDRTVELHCMAASFSTRLVCRARRSTSIGVKRV